MVDENGIMKGAFHICFDMNDKHGILLLKLWYIPPYSF